jgi:hypothetical protein
MADLRAYMQQYGKRVPAEMLRQLEEVEKRL